MPPTWLMRPVKPATSTLVKLQVPDHNFSTQVITNANGVFTFPKVLVRDSSKVILTAGGSSGNRNMMITLSGTAAQAVNKNPQQPELWMLAAELARLNGQKTMEVEYSHRAALSQPKNSRFHLGGKYGRNA